MAGRTEGLWSSGVNNASSNGELSTGGCIAYTYKHKGTPHMHIIILGAYVQIYTYICVSPHT